MNEQVVGWAASTWGFAMALAPILQATRISRTGSAEDVSVGYYAVLIPGFVLWVLYGALSHNWFIVAPNAMATATGIGLLALISVTRKRGRRGTRSTLA